MVSICKVRETPRAFGFAQAVVCTGAGAGLVSAGFVSAGLAAAGSIFGAGAGACVLSAGGPGQRSPTAPVTSDASLTDAVFMAPPSKARTATKPSAAIARTPPPAAITKFLRILNSQRDTRRRSSKLVKRAYLRGSLPLFQTNLFVSAFIRHCDPCLGRSLADRDMSEAIQSFFRAGLLRRLSFSKTSNSSYSQ